MDRLSPAIALSAVDDSLLQRLVEVATTDASPDEVTPPLTGGGTWTPERIAWLEDYHRSRRAGLNGPLGEATWAVLRGSSPVGAVRLQRGDETGVLEAGIWLARAARGTGAAHEALRAIRDEARTHGARLLVADTSAENRRACALLRKAGFALEAPTPEGRIRATLRLGV